MRRKNKNNLREFEPQNSKKFKNIQAELKNVVSYKKKSVMTVQYKKPPVQKKKKCTHEKFY